mmetsp:Transcript_823/g.2383  ORF Transcript_823/g.2383 Transcript_823/m.2383 type:complete len:217 (-) Transcript_823:156-806(-)
MMFSSPMKSESTGSSPTAASPPSAKEEQFQYIDPSLNHPPASPSVVSQNADDDELTLGDQVTRLFRPNHDIVEEHKDVGADADDDTIGDGDGREPTEEDFQKYQTASTDNSADREQHRAQFRAMGGAAVVGGVAGMMLLGPIVGLVAAGGAAAAAVAAPGQTGERVRATGEVVAKAGDKIKQLEQEHQIVDKVTQGFHKTATFFSDRLEPCYNPTA